MLSRREIYGYSFDTDEGITVFAPRGFDATRLGEIKKIRVVVVKEEVTIL